MDRRLRSQFFTLHIWKEELGDERCEWRGRVRHVPSGTVCYFREWATLVLFLDRVTQSPEEVLGTGAMGQDPQAGATDSPMA